MKTLYWDSTDPLDCFDNPNCRWGNPSYRLEEGDPGYVPWTPPGSTPPPGPPRASVRTGRTHRSPHQPAQSPTTTTDHPMNIPYHTRPTADGTKVTTQIAYRGTKTKAEITAEIQARLVAQNLPMTIENVLRIHDEVIIDFGMDAWKCDPVGHLGHFFTSGGASSDLQGPWTFKTMKMDLSCHLDDDGTARAEAAFNAHNLGHKSRVMPVFARVSDSWTKLPDHYTAGKSVLIELGNRGGIVFDLTKGHKVQWKLTSGTLVEADDYGFVEGSRITARVPAQDPADAPITGALELVLTIGVNGRTVTDTYDHPLSP
jgi:hypothetical protein